MLTEKRKQVVREAWAVYGELEQPANIYATVEAVLAEQPAQPPAGDVAPAIKNVICNDCKGHQIFTVEGDTIYVLHDCVNGKHVREIWEQQKREHEQQLKGYVRFEDVEKVIAKQMVEFEGYDVGPSKALASRVRNRLAKP